MFWSKLKLQYYENCIDSQKPCSTDHLELAVYFLYFLLFFLSICLPHTVRLQDIWTELTQLKTQRYRGREHAVFSAKDHSFSSNWIESNEYYINPLMSLMMLIDFSFTQLQLSIGQLNNVGSHCSFLFCLWQHVKGSFINWNPLELPPNIKATK